MTKHRYDNPGVPPPCLAVYQDEHTFGSGWNHLRTVTYTGVTHSAPPGSPWDIHGVAEVTQSVAVYPNPTAARTAFDRLNVSLKSFAALHNKDFQFTLDDNDPATTAVNSDTWKNVYHVKSSALITVGALGFEDTGGPPPEQIAQAVAQRIAARIP